MPIGKTTQWGLSAERAAAWEKLALCAYDPDLMHPESLTQEQLWPIRMVCAPCPVRTECLTDGLREPADWSSIRGGLTGKERRRLHREGLEPAGAALELSPLTVKTYAQQCMRKLGARNRVQAVTIAFVRRLLELPSEAEASS